MAKNFTLPASLITSKKKAKNPTTPEVKIKTTLEPSDSIIEFLLNYSKSLQVISTKSVGYINNIKN
jgi:hypothetical protein